MSTLLFRPRLARATKIASTSPTTRNADEIGILLTARAFIASCRGVRTDKPNARQKRELKKKELRCYLKSRTGIYNDSE